MLTTSEVARMIHVHINTVRKWSDMGLIETYRIGSRGDRRFKVAYIERFISGSTFKKQKVELGPNVVGGAGTSEKNVLILKPI